MEEWRQIDGWPYEVSNLGNVRRTHHINGRAPSMLKPRGTGRDRGYRAVALHSNGKIWFVRVHQLVAAAFIGPCPPGHEVNHIDGVKGHNAAINLEYVTPVENQRHAWRTGLKPRPVRGERHPIAKLTEAEVLVIRNRGLHGDHRSIAAEFGVSQVMISKICRGAAWPHVGGPRSRFVRAQKGWRHVQIDAA